MPRPVLSRAALRDLDEILDHLTREAGQTIATKYRREIMHRLALVGDHPDMGTPRPALGRGVRRDIVSPYLIFYRPAQETVTVLRILHGRRRITAALIRRTS
jgi:toxin ParE1/3/4